MNRWHEQQPTAAGEDAALRETLGRMIRGAIGSGLSVSAAQPESEETRRQIPQMCESKYFRETETWKNGEIFKRAHK